MTYAYFLFMSTCINNVINLHYRCSDSFFYIRYVLPSYQKSCITFFSAQHYIRLQDRLLYIKFVDRLLYIKFVFVHISINLKQRPVQNMGKNIKSYATTQVHFPREREGSLTAKGPNLSFKIWYGLTVHIIRF